MFLRMLHVTDRSFSVCLQDHYLWFVTALVEIVFLQVCHFLILQQLHLFVYLKNLFAVLSQDESSHNVL